MVNKNEGMHVSYYKQPYTINGIDITRIDDELTIEFHDVVNEKITIYGGDQPNKSRMHEMQASSVEAKRVRLKLPTSHCPYYFYALIGNKETAIFSERILPLKGAINIRDMGGYETVTGKVVKWGVLYRGDQLSKLTDCDITILERAGLKTIIDFRSSHECSVYPNRTIKTVKYVVNCNPQSHFSEMAGQAINLDDENQKLIDDLENGSICSDLANGSGKVSLQSYEKLVDEPESQQAYRKMLYYIINNEYAPSLQHCRGGKDRTGYGTMLILSLLGVSQDDILTDYLITKAVRDERNQVKLQQYKALTSNQNYLDYLMSLIDTRSDYLLASINRINSAYSGVENYARDILGVTDEQIIRMKEYYLEDK